MTGRRLAPYLFLLVELLVLGGIAWFMLNIRLLNYDLMVQPGAVYFQGTDPYYHLRVVIATLANFPHSMTFDPMTQYPYGTYTGQFGTLFDQAIAFVILLFHGFTVPDTYTVQQWVAVYPAVLGALIVFPVYFLGKRLGGPLAGLAAALVIAILPGQFLYRSVVGHSDHHVAEALLAAAGLLALIAVLDAGRDSGLLWRDRSTWTRDRWLKPLLLALLAAVTLWAYIDVWPPAILLVVVAGIALAIQAVADHVTRRETDGLLAAAAATFLFLAILLLLAKEVTGFVVSMLSALQPTLALLALIGVLALGALSNWARARGLPVLAYPAILAGAGLAGWILFRLVMPDAYNVIAGGSSWVFGGVGSTTLTIAEVRATCEPTESFTTCARLVSSFGRLHVLAFIGFIALLVTFILRRRPGEILVAVWAFFMGLAAMNQIRFTYYAAVVVALLAGLLVGLAADALKVPQRLEDFLDRRESAKKPVAKGRRAGRGAGAGAALGTPFRAVAVIAVALILVAAAMPTLQAKVFCGSTDRNNLRTAPAWEEMECNGPNDEPTWAAGLHWIRDNTPPVSLSLEQLYEDAPLTNTRYDYPEGTYGVLAWWDYGHWIQTMAERPPVANPFQQQAPFASVYFTSQSEAKAEELLANLTGPENEVRYIVIDDASATGKFGAITVWANQHYRSFGGDAFPSYRENDPNDPAYIERTYQRADGQGTLRVPTYTTKYDASMMSRLYNDDAEGLERYRLVYEFPGFSCIGTFAEETGTGLQAVSRNDVYNYVPYSDLQNRPNSLCALGDTGDVAYRVSDTQWGYDLRAESQLKVFERVAGALLTGTAPPGSVVTVSVPLRAEGSGREFTYTQETRASENGQFQIRVPYASTGYLQPEQGGTDTDVRATAPYTLTRGGQQVTVNVPDEATLRGLTVQVPDQG